MLTFLRKSNCWRNNLQHKMAEIYPKSYCTKIDYQEIERQRQKEELEVAVNIEKSLFGQSHLRHEPQKVSDVIRESRKLQQQQQKQQKQQKGQRKRGGQRPETTLSKEMIITNETEKIAYEPTFSIKNLQSGKTSTKDKSVATSETIKDKDTGLEFVKLSPQDSRLLSLMTTIRSRKRRDKQQQIILEGRRLIKEAFYAHLKVNAIIFSQKEELQEIAEQLKQIQNNMETMDDKKLDNTKLKRENLKIYKVPHHDLKMWSTLNTPPGLMAIFQRPEENPEEEGGTTDDHDMASVHRLPITVICDNIREPNNLGSIIRTCAALPCKQIILTKGCCDPWESKALRAGCGGQFRLSIRDDVEWERIPLFIPPEVADDCHIFIAENKKNLQPNDGVIMMEYTNISNIGKHNLVIIGGETHGISNEAYGLLKTVGIDRGKCIHIPVAEGIDSLNVVSALTLILYELRRHIPTICSN